MSTSRKKRDSNDAQNEKSPNDVENDDDAKSSPKKIRNVTPRDILDILDERTLANENDYVKLITWNVAGLRSGIL
jgi:hypothetical protein